MHIELDPNTSAVINNLVSKGGFDNPMHVIQYAVHTLDVQDSLHGWTKEELRVELQKGIDSINAGRVYDAEAVFDDIDKQFDA